MKTLIKMTAFVKEQVEQFKNDGAPQRINLIGNYANFLSLTPQLWHFVPCDSEGNVLPKAICYDGMDSHDFELFNQYQQAKERCYFDGCVAKKIDDCYLITNDGGNVWASWNKDRTLEDLIPYNLSLTATAQKEIV